MARVMLSAHAMERNHLIESILELDRRDHDAETDDGVIGVEFELSLCLYGDGTYTLTRGEPGDDTEGAWASVIVPYADGIADDEFDAEALADELLLQLAPADPPREDVLLVTVWP